MNRSVRVMTVASLMLASCAPAGGTGDPDDVGRQFGAVRVSVRSTGTALEVTGAYFTLEEVPERTAPEESIGTLRVEDASGRVLDTVEVPRPAPLSIIGEDGPHGHAIRPDTTSIVIAWPEGAHAVRGAVGTGSGGGGTGGGTGGGGAGGVGAPSGPAVTPQPPSALSPAGMVATPMPGTTPTPSGGVDPSALPAVVAVHQTGPSEKRFDFVVVGDGYGAANHAQFVSDVQRFSQKLLAVEPYQTFSRYINVWAVPTKVTAGGPTALQCHHNCQGIQRVICCDEGATFAVARSAVPDAESVLVVYNSTEYGGAGGRIGTSYSGPSMPTVLLHELGHTLGLDDEYVYSSADASVYEEEEGVNCSAQNPPHWDHWLDLPEVDAFPGCSFSSLWRPTDSACLMRELAAGDYCAVCREHVTLRIYEALGGLIESATPATDLEDPAELTIGDMPTRFELMTYAVGEPTYEWILDFEVASEDGPSFEVDACAVPESTLLDAKVTDHSEFVREDPHGYMTDAVRWELNADPDAQTGACLPMCIGDACELGTACCDQSVVCYPTSTAMDAPAQCCAIAETHCGGDSDCCGEMRCVDGACACQAVGQPCVSHRECCDAAFCNAGVCALE